MPLLRAAFYGERPISVDDTARFSSKIATLHRYWLERHRADGGLPRRSDIDPLEITRAAPDLLPHLWLVDVLRAPYRFRYRLIGGAVNEAGTLARVGDLIEPAGGLGGNSSLYDNLVWVCEEKCPNHRRGAPTLLHSKHVEQIERVSLPLVDDQGQVTMILSGPSIAGRRAGAGYASPLDPGNRGAIAALFSRR